ncbi:MAG: DUF3576 domain-containing protein [Rhodobacteraceae bacterium]|nr:DUF3576 domain-containing protein [Paracoccaceae bacterium]
MSRFVSLILSGLLIVSLTACGNSGLFRNRTGKAVEVDNRAPDDKATDAGSFFDLFTGKDDPNVTIGVNKYLWNAALDVLNFLPVEAADPFSGVIVMGWGTPPGSGRSYRATVYIQDPALDARSLKLALVSRSGAAPKDTVRALEDAILTRARQLRIADSKL